MAASLVLHGRTLDVVRAVTRDVATKLKETNERAREKEDKRNTYLLREGGMSSHSYPLIKCSLSFDSYPIQCIACDASTTSRTRTPHRIIQLPQATSQLKPFTFRLQDPSECPPDTHLRQRKSVEKACDTCNQNVPERG